MRSPVRPLPGVGVQDLHLALTRLDNVRVAVTNMADVVDAVQVLEHTSLQRGELITLLPYYLFTIFIIQILSFPSYYFQGVTFEEKFAGGSNMFLA